MSKFTKIIYFLLFVFLLLQPHIFQGHISFFSSASLQSILTFLVFGVAYGIYLLHKEDIQKREKEKQKLSDEVVSNYEYIGLLNRRVPLLKEITTGVLSRRKVTKNEKKEIFNELLTLATISVGKGKRGLFRFVHTQSFHTLKEFQLVVDQQEKNFQKVSNKEMMSLLYQNSVHVTDEHYILGSSETNLPIRCIYVLAPSESLEKDQLVVLQAIVDQAQLLYSHLYLQTSSA